MIAEPDWATIRREVAGRKAQQEAARQADRDREASLAALDDAALLAALKHGGEAAEKHYFDELFRRFAPAMQAALFERFDTQTAWDAFGRTWLRVKRTRGHAIPDGQVRPALFSLAFNAATNIQRQQ